VKFELVASPKKALVVFKGDKIEILQQVHFETGKATIMADSNSLLKQVVDAIVKNGVKRVRVEGHTDNRGKKDANQKLSDDRARAVADYLIAQGLDAQRVESVGYGDSKPVAPNLTARGRELNRRVEFIVLEK
jgi:OmpA-OmpF porin, OOP family